jgi:hypothetical protein
MRHFDGHTPGIKRDFRGCPPHFIVTNDVPPEHRSKPLHEYLRQINPDARAKDTMAQLCQDLFAKPREIAAALRSETALRCWFLIPTTPALNPRPDTLSAPSEPEWLRPDVPDEDDRESIFDTVDRDTVHIMMGMS